MGDQLVGGVELGGSWLLEHAVTVGLWLGIAVGHGSVSAIIYYFNSIYYAFIYASFFVWVNPPFNIYDSVYYITMF